MKNPAVSCRIFWRRRIEQSTAIAINTLAPLSIRRIGVSLKSLHNASIRSCEAELGNLS
jgi:hypothetical protein